MEGVVRGRTNMNCPCTRLLCQLTTLVLVPSDLTYAAQDAIAADALSVHKGYLLGGIAWCVRECVLESCKLTTGGMLV